MAYYYNYKFWLATAADLSNILFKISAFNKIKPTKDKLMAHNIISLIYTRYTVVVNRLSYLFDVTLQVQKRALIKRLLEAATNRLMELRNELKQIELSEYIYLDDSLIKLKVILDDVQLLRPFYFPMARDAQIQDLVDEKTKRKMNEDDISQTSFSVTMKMNPKRRVSRQRLTRKSSFLQELALSDPDKYSRIMAANIIKIHEKARKGRVFLTNIRYNPEKYRPQAPDIGKGFFYEYTHKPDQPMLIMIRRTYYDSNYFIERQISDKVDYYVRPEHRKLKLRDKSARKSRSSDEESFDDDFIQFEDGFGEEMPMFEYEKSFVETVASTWDTGSKSVFEDLKQKLESMTSFGDLSQIAQSIQLMEEMPEGDEGGIATEIMKTIRDGSKLLDPGQTERKLSGLLRPPSADGKSKSFNAEIVVPDGNEMDHLKIEQTSVIMERRTKSTDIPSSRKPSGITIGRSKKGISSPFSRKSMDISNADDMTAVSFQSLLAKKLEDSAALVIQLTWRRFLLRRRIERRKLRKFILYGMVSGWRWDKKLNKDLDQDRIKLRSKKAMFDRFFIQACENEKSRILKVRGPWIMEDISDHIRAWFREFYDGVGEFDRYPEEFEGGTILVIRGETMTVEEYRQAKEEKKKKKKKTPEEKKKEREARKAEREKKKEQKRKEKQAAKLQKLLEAKEGKTYDFAKESPYFTELKEIMNEYNTEWANIDEKHNIREEPYMEWISLDKFAEVHQELRAIVDEFMRVEFEILRKALAEDQKKKYKPQKKKKQKKKKGKRGRKGKKQPKDITADRTTESLFFELQTYGLIKKIPPTNLDEYIGEYNYSAYEKRIIYQMDPLPGQGEIKDVIREAIRGMGPLDFAKAKSMLLAGPRMGGKEFLVNSICSEIGAVVLDISPEKVVQFEDNMKYFIHLINKMARILQPTVLFIDKCERIFWKKVPKEDAYLKPRLLGKYIIKQIVKPIKKEEKVLVLGLSHEPFKAKLGKMKKCFEKVIVVPRADYGTTFQLHRTLCLQKYGVPRDFEFSPVSMVVKGYSSSMIYNRINNTLGIERRMKLTRNPLKAQEFVEGFLNTDEPQFPISDDDFAKYTKFYTKVNKLAKQRDKFMKQQAKLKEKLQKGGKK